MRIALIILFYVCWHNITLAQTAKVSDLSFFKKLASDDTGEYISIGDTVRILEFYDNGHCKVMYKGKVGYIAEVALLKDDSFRSFKSKQQIKKYNDANLIKAAQQKKIADANRKSYLIKKYGVSNGTSIFNRIVKIGMTQQMVKEVYGEPDDINRTVTQYSSSEQWVYGKGEDMELFYFENGKLTAWQD